MPGAPGARSGCRGLGRDTGDSAALPVQPLARAQLASAPEREERGAEG